MLIYITFLYFVYAIGIKYKVFIILRLLNNRYLTTKSIETIITDINYLLKSFGRLVSEFEVEISKKCCICNVVAILCNTLTSPLLCYSSVRPMYRKKSGGFKSGERQKTQVNNSLFQWMYDMWHYLVVTTIFFIDFKQRIVL